MPKILHTTLNYKTLVYLLVISLLSLSLGFCYSLPYVCGLLLDTASPKAIDIADYFYKSTVVDRIHVCFVLIDMLECIFELYKAV